MHSGSTVPSPTDNPASDRVELIRLLTHQQDFILAYAYAIVRDHHLAEDVYQEVALILARDWESIPPDAPHPWLKELVRRKALEVARRARRHVLFSHETLTLLAEALDATAESDGTQLRAAMADCVRKLPADARLVVEGRYRDGETCEAIATRIGRSVQGVYALLKRTRTALAECVARVGGGAFSDA